MTPEQAVKVFLDLPHEEQVQRMGILLESSRRAHACFMRDHAGAEAFSRNHSCRKYQEGWDAALAEFQKLYSGGKR